MRLRTAMVIALGALLVQPAPAGSDAGAPRTVAVVKETPGGGLEVATFETADLPDAQAAVAQLEGAPEVVSVEVDGRWTLASGGVAPLGTDPLRPQQWHLDKVGAPAAWRRGAGDLIVAVLDTGVDASHPDLAGRVLPGWDFIHETPSSSDNGEHGTLVAGMVTALADNGIGISPTVRDVRILPAVVCAPDAAETTCPWSDVARGIIWAVDHGASVINLSLGGEHESSTVKAAIDYALGKGVVVVAAAGNDGQKGNPRHWPAAFAGVIGVAATTKSDVASTWSSQGDWVDLAAPGDAILSTRPGGAYGTAWGTSYAAPQVAAAAALVRKADPSRTPAQIEALLTSTARDIHSAGWDARSGAGILDIAAVADVVARCPDGGVTADQVCRLYLAFFGRSPDVAGHKAWVDARFAGTPVTAIADAFAASTEFRNRYGSLSDPAFVDLVYRNVLNREPDSAGRSYWTGRLGAGMTRGQVMAQFSESPEFVARTATRPWRDATTLQIERLYLAFFLREADAAGLQQWVALRWFGIPLPLIAEHFAASPEFRNRYGSLSNPAFVDLVYSNVLHRSPDPAGKSYWTARLNAGATRGQVMVEFSESAEFVTRTRTAP